MTFTDIELATIYMQAGNRKNQLQIFQDTEGQTIDEIIERLVRGGVDRRTLPKEYKVKKTVDPETIGHHDVRSFEDEIIMKLDEEAEEQKKRLASYERRPDPVLQPDEHEVETGENTGLIIKDNEAIAPLDMAGLENTLTYIRKLFEYKKRLEHRLEEVNEIIERIVEASK